MRTSITLNTGAQVVGRALARNGAVTLDTNSIDGTACTVPVPTLSQWSMIGLTTVLTAAGFLALRRRRITHA